MANKDTARGNPSGFAELAKRISGWTSKLVVSAVVLVAGVVFARQVLRWWDAPPSGPGQTASQPAGDARGDPARPRLLRFGDQPWTVRRQAILGTRAEALEAAARSCAEVVAECRLPEEDPSPTERRFLDMLARGTPVRQQPGKWQVHQIDGPAPMAAGVRPVPAAPGTPEDGVIATPPFRVVAWALAFPAAARGWTLLTFLSTGSKKEPLAELPEVALPPGSQRVLSVRGLDGSGLVSFRGKGRVEVWVRFYDSWFSRVGWSTTTGWSQVGPVWSGRFVGEGQSGGSADVQLGSQGQGELSGLVMIGLGSAPPESDPAKGPNLEQDDVRPDEGRPRDRSAGPAD